MKIKFLILPILIFFSVFGFVYAQFELPSLTDDNSGLPIGITEQLSVTIIPKIPAPGQDVSIFIESFSSNLNKANLIWSANGKVVTQGMGMTKVTVRTPQSGETLKIDVTIQKEEGGIVQRSFTFAPADVEIIYEADTYTPPFYKGKPLFTSESTMRFIAMPTFVGAGGQVMDPKDLVYTWKIDDSVIQDASGYGRRVFNYKGGLIQNDIKVGVEVSAVNSVLKAKGDVYVYVKQPEVVLYENNPLLGVVYERGAIGSFLLERPEIELQAVPYYFSTKKKDNSEIDYTWKVNGITTEIDSKMSFSRFRNETGKEGLSIIGIDVQHFYNILQFAQTSLELNFKANENNLGNTFGL